MEPKKGRTGAYCGKSLTEKNKDGLGAESRSQTYRLG